MKRTFYLVEDHSLMRQGIINFLCQNSNYECKGSSASEVDFFEYMEESGNDKPQILITDLNLDGQYDSGLTLIQNCTKRFPDVKIVVYSMHSAASIASAAIDAGAKGYVSKLSDEAELRKAIESVIAGQLYVEPQIAKNLLAFEHTISRFTKREVSILRLILLKKSNADIADELGLNKRTIENCISRIYTKTGFSTREEMIKYWEEE